MKKPMEERFARLTDRSGECWIWRGAVNSVGYGVMSVNKRSTHAHRASYEFFVGPIPIGLLVCHKCDNRRCVRPDHLFVGNYKDNTQDASRKKRLRGQNKTHCLRGHIFNEANTYFSANGTRHCRECGALFARQYRKEKRAAP